VELPQLAELNAQLAREPEFRMVAIACDDASNVTLQENVRAFADYTKLGLALYADDERTTTTAATLALEAAYVVFPTTIVLDRQGTIRGVWEGYSPRAVEQMSLLVRELLSAQADAAASPVKSD
jgi:hypothetical protein